MKLKAPRTRPPKKPTKHQAAAIVRIAKSDPPVVCVSVTDRGLHYSIGNGDRISNRMVWGMVGRGWLASNNDGMPGMTPQSYRLVYQPQAEVPEAGE